MIINSQMVSELIHTKQEPAEEDEMKPIYTNDTLHQQQQQQKQNQKQQTNEDCNNNLNNMSNRNLKIELKTMFNNSNSSKEYGYQDQPHSGARCTGCHHPIEDKYVFNLMNTYWHEECLQCSQCRVSLKKTCFFKNGLIFCKDDYFKQFGTRCNACYELILSNELIMRFLVNNPNSQQQSAEKQLLNYHLNCFKCIACERLLQKGDEFVLKSEGIFCKHDYEQSFQASHSTLLNRLNSATTTTSTLTPRQFNSEELNSMPKVNKQATPRKSSSSRRITKRPRTILNAVQRYDFREAFKQSPKPCRKVREHLASKTGLSVRVVQVWFQNERAKMKKMQRRQQQSLLNQKLNKKNGKSLKKGSSSSSKKTSSKRKTIDSDSIISEENSLAGEEDEFGVEDEDEESDDESDEEFDESDDELDEEEEEEEDEEITRLNRLTCNLASNNNTSSSSSSSSSTSSLSEFNAFMPQQQHQQQSVYPPLAQQQLYFQQHNQMVNNPIDRLYSMQNAYFV